MTIEEAKQYILEGGKITEEQALSLANHPDKEALYEAAHQITRHFMGNKFDTCSIINAKSGNCSEDCKWCAIGTLQDPRKLISFASGQGMCLSCGI